MMRATAFGIGLAMLGGIGIAQAQVPGNPGAGGGMQPGRPVLLLPLPNGGYSIANQNGQAGGAGQAAGAQGPGIQMLHGPMGNEAMHQRMEHHAWMRRETRGEEGGAIFAFRSRRGNIFIRCAPDEPMRACVAAASLLIDKIASMHGQGPQPPKGPPGRGPNSGIGMPSPGKSPPGSPPGTPPSGSPGSSSGSSSGTGSGSGNSGSGGSSSSGH